ncbi:unnamed protein product [Arabis nemorensis]|uniref:Pectinesterase inhibitor domain-containing protein n=1 Tax=Arabis nemorensis TaxID=586526 RepID=A0A565B4L1_9BRAS|nr:unnamed protein product [Arabis nemorensis]
MNIHRLLELAVKKTRAFGLETQALMSDLARVSGNDKQLKQSFEACVQGYGVSIKKLEEAKEFLSKSSFESAYYAVAKAHEYSYVCKDQFEGPSNEPALALNRSEKFISVCHIVWNLAEVLLN